MIRRFVFSLFAFAVLSSFGADPVYYLVSTSQGDFGTYIYNPSVSSSDSFGGLAFSRDKSSFSGYVSINGSAVPCSGSAISYQDYSDGLTSGGIGYIPFSSDPVYSSNNPNGAPLSGGGSPSGGGSGGGSPSGGGGEGGFDPAGSFGGLSSVLGAVALALGGLLTAAALVCLAFLYWRKTKTSFHICEDRYGRLSLSKTRW